MRRYSRLALVLALFGVALVLAAQPRPVLAHGHIDVGNYELVIGFRNEPAYQGEPNGLDLIVTNTQTNTPVMGLEDTLKAEISFGGATRSLELRARWGRDGAYTAEIVPTEAGDYTWRIFGDIEGTPVDVSMTSSPDTFSSVQPKAAVAFPAAEPTAAELRAADTTMAQTVQLALIAGIAGVVLGIIGMVLGVMGIRARGRSLRAPETAGQTIHSAR